jgi:hypothetical protein
MQIGTVEALARSIGFDPGVETAVLESAVSAATQRLVALLGTELEQAAVTDRFFVLANGSLPQGSVYSTRLALSRGFVQGSVTLSYGSVLTAITVPLDTTMINIDYEKGGIVIIGPNLSGQYISASYTAGFAADPENSNRYAGLPSWLTDVATLAAMAALDSNSPNTRYPDGKNSRNSWRDAQASVASLMQQVVSRLGDKVRYFPNATRPIG